MFFIRLHTAVLLVSALLAVLAGVSFQRTGWLDRVVAYHKNRFINDVEKYAPIKINAEIRPKPPGYVDSGEWNFESVVRLLTLIRQSENAIPIQRTLRRMLQPTRRIMMSMKDSMKHFPSLSKQEKNNFYYDILYTSEEDESVLPPQPMIPEDEVVLVVSNPVEARLPSARISVKLLREILEARARAARMMPSTPPSTIWWRPMNKTERTEPPAGGGASSDVPGGDGGGKETTASKGSNSEGETTLETTSEEPAGN